MKKFAVCTTFPNSYFDVCAAEMLETFHKNWPQDIKLFIQLDEQTPESFKAINNKIIDIVGEERSFIANAFEEDQLAFIARWKDHKPSSYLFDVVKFSHKVFALEKCADAVKDSVDYLIWLDADVITKQKVDHEWLESLMPGDDEVVSYLHRAGFYSECGFVAYNMKHGGYELLEQMKNEYVLGNFSEKAYSRGTTDCHVIDFCLKNKKFRNLSAHYKVNESDINVWPETRLAERLVHRKGNRKVQAAENRGKVQQKTVNAVDANDLKIKTRNCLDHSKIKANVTTNLSQIRAWASLCKANPGQKIIMCAAGPSLVNHIDEIKRLQKEGGKVIAVKHAIDTLNAHGVVPWAVVLLDPRAHVEGFVKNPDPRPFYFVASMCDPSVVKTLNDNKCKVIGYHAFVNAGETEVMVPSDLPVSGGSATSTRSIGLFGDMFGYKEFHLFGYDLSHHQKPNLEEKNSDGQPKYMEINIGTQTHKNKYITRTFWTEGQFLAQSNELKDLYKNRKDLNIVIYGDGLAGWLYKHHILYEKFRAEYNKRLDEKRAGTPTLDEYVTAATRGADLARAD